MLAFDTLGAQHVLVARIAHQRPLILVRSLTAGEFRYLVSATAGGQWLRQWGTGITAPLGIGVILDHGVQVDTLILRIGGRG